MQSNTQYRALLSILTFLGVLIKSYLLNTKMVYFVSMMETLCYNMFLILAICLVLNKYDRASSVFLLFAY